MPGRFFTKKNLILIAVFAAIICIRFYFLSAAIRADNFNQNVIRGGGDAADYLRIGRNIANFQVYGDQNANHPTENATWRTPVWPFVLSLLFLFSDNLILLVAAKCLFESLLILLILHLFKKRSEFGPIQLLPFSLLFLEPQYIKYSVTFLSESLTAILILLLVLMVVFYKQSQQYKISIPIVAALIILCHPVASFFVIVLFGLYLLYNLKFGFKFPIVHGLLFSLIVIAWPCRNYLTFDKVFFMTASQGTTFSKGWNEKVATDFTNVDGDMSDENMNLKYIGMQTLPRQDSDILNGSKLYSKATWKFLETIPLSEKIKIALIKIKSNFYPFPEKTKAGYLENLGTLFRIFYAVAFVALIVRIFRRKFNFEKPTDRIYMVILAIATGQIFMSVYIYTGLRFNSIYGLAMLFCVLYLCQDFFGRKLKVRN